MGRTRRPGNRPTRLPRLQSQQPVAREHRRCRTALGNLSVAYLESPLAVLNNGHTIQVNYAPGSSLTFDGKTYALLQFHFHAPSEHEIDGSQTPLEMHLVHQAADGEFAVLGVMIVEGLSNAAFQKFLDRCPIRKALHPPPARSTPSHCYPTISSTTPTTGSFTTPPCTEGVKWSPPHPIEVSGGQIAAFRSLEFLNHDGEFIGNARPVQPLNGRLGATPSSPRITAPNTGDGGCGEKAPNGDVKAG